MLKNKLIHALGRNLDCNLARLKCLSLLIHAVLKQRTSNLSILATTQDGKSCSNESRYRRFQDFFLNFSLCLDAVAHCILERIPKPPGGFVLAMDRTNWKFGKRHINFLAIAIIAGKVSIPVVWKVLPAKTKGGNSNAAQRKTLIKRLLALIPASDIHVLTMDREFTGKQWLAWLEKQSIDYILRIKKNTLIDGVSAGERASKRGRKKQSRQDVFGLSLFFGSKRIQKGGRDSHLLVVSNRFSSKEALELYRLRWGIERMFGHLKKNGFDLEATHMTNEAKLEKLFAVVTLAFTYSFAWGCHLRHTGQKSAAAANRKSLFRLGLEDIKAMIDPDLHEQLAKNRLPIFFSWITTATFDSIFLV